MNSYQLSPIDATFPISDFLSMVTRGDVENLPGKFKYLFRQENMKGDVIEASRLFPYADPQNCLVKLNRISEPMKQECRVFALLELCFGKAPATVQGHLDTISRFIIDMKQYGVWDYRRLTLDDVVMIFRQKGYSATKCLKTSIALLFFFNIMHSFCRQTLYSLDLKGLESLRCRYSSYLSATKEARKTPDIDEEYFDILQDRLLVLAMDECLNINYRMSAALLLFEMSVGLRPSELLTLKTGSHKVKTAINGKELDFLTYGVPKLSHGGKIERYAECWMLPGAVSAFELLLSLRNIVPGHDNTDTLFILTPNSKTTIARFRYYVERLFLIHLSDLAGTEWEYVKHRVIDGCSYYIPSLTQFRVHTCGFLYRLGVPLYFIELGMSHLFEAMVSYYYRTQDKTFRKEMSRVDNLIRTKINNDFSLEDQEEKGPVLLKRMLLSLGKFRTYQERLVEMEKKGYFYDVDRYKKLGHDIINTELMPAFDYLSMLLEKEGRDKVVNSFPSLVRVVSNMSEIINELQAWKKQQKI